jgi:hypothetical protein
LISGDDDGSLIVDVVGHVVAELAVIAAAPVASVGKR